MKAQNGGRGMKDDEVKGYRHVLVILSRTSDRQWSCRFIDRYIPGYIFFSEGVLWDYNPSEGRERDDTSAVPPWIGHGLRIILSLEREVEEVQHF
jgi:D-glycerate 3-kinase